MTRPVSCCSCVFQTIQDLHILYKVVYPKQSRLICNIEYIHVISIFAKLLLTKESIMKCKQMYMEFSRLSEYGKSLSLLFARLAVAYGFYEPAMMKWSDIGSVAEWFGSMGIPFPTLNAYMAASTEAVGVILLTLGLLTRFISLPLIIVMIVAIMTVHLPHGFSAGDNGFEIPLYYMLFLLVFVSYGAGKFSLDRLIFGDKS